MIYLYFDRFWNSNVNSSAKNSYITIHINQNVEKIYFYTKNSTSKNWVNLIVENGRPLYCNTTRGYAWKEWNGNENMICYLYFDRFWNAYQSAVWLLFRQNPNDIIVDNIFLLDFAQIVTKQMIDKQNWKIFLISPNIKYCFFYEFLA